MVIDWPSKKRKRRKDLQLNEVGELPELSGNRPMEKVEAKISGKNKRCQEIKK